MKTILFIAFVCLYTYFFFASAAKENAENKLKKDYICSLVKEDQRNLPITLKMKKECDE